MLDLSKRAVCQFLRLFWNTLFHQCVAVVTVYVVWISCQNYIHPFSWHVILSTLGVIPILATSLILFARYNVWSVDVEKDGKRWLHGILGFVSLVLVIAGIAVEIDRKEKVMLSHFTSAHAIMGLMSMIFFSIAFISGFLTFVPYIFREYIAPVWYKIIHDVIGQIGYVMALVCLILGYFTDYFTFYTSLRSRIAVSVVTGIIGAWSLFHSCKSIYKHIRRLFGHVPKYSLSSVPKYKQSYNGILNSFLSSIFR